MIDNYKWKRVLQRVVKNSGPGCVITAVINDLFNKILHLWFTYLG